MGWAMEKEMQREKESSMAEIQWGFQLVWVYGLSLQTQ